MDASDLFACFPKSLNSYIDSNSNEDFRFIVIPVVDLLKDEEDIPELRQEHIIDLLSVVRNRRTKVINALEALNFRFIRVRTKMDLEINFCVGQGSENLDIALTQEDIST
jgi:hypothetical protein